MSSLLRLITDIDGAMGEGLEDRRARAVIRVTDLFVLRAAEFGEDQVGLFDAVIQRLAGAVDVAARMELAGKLACVPNAPRGVIRRLARDEIGVAREVLAFSDRLDDQDLMAIALDLGRDHMLAICERPRISPPVTEVLVEFGDGVVKHAVLANPGASFSPSAIAVLVEQAGTDAGLHHLLSERADLPDLSRRRLDDLTRDITRSRLARSVSAGPSGNLRPGGRDYADAMRALRAVMANRQLSERDLADFAAAGRLDCAILVIVSLTGLTVDCVEAVFGETESDLPIVIGKAQAWSWRTVKALLQLRNPGLTDRLQLRPAENAFDTLDTAGAQRMVHFMKVRDHLVLPDGASKRPATARR